MRRLAQEWDSRLAVASFGFEGGGKTKPFPASLQIYDVTYDYDNRRIAINCQEKTGEWSDVSREG